MASGNLLHLVARRRLGPVAFFCVLILASLGSALYYMVADRGQSKRTVKALAVRVGLSLTLFLLLMAGYYFGLIPGKIT